MVTDLCNGPGGGVQSLAKNLMEPIKTGDVYVLVKELLARQPLGEAKVEVEKMIKGK